MVTASIVTYNHSLSDFEPVLRSLFASPVSKIYVIDHSDKVDDLESALKGFLVKEVKAGPEVIYIHHENNGYGGGHNVALREAMKEGCRYHLVVNPDVWFGPEVIPALINYMDEHPDTGQMIPNVLYPNGEIQRVAKLLPTPLDMFGRLCLPRRFVKTRNDRFELKPLGTGRTLDVPYLSGCFMFFRMSTLEDIGLFDEHFFMYAEDIDITRRIHQSGYHTLFYPECFIYHTFSRASRKSLRLFLIHVANIVLYFNKWGWWRDPGRMTVNSKALAQ